MTGGHGFGAEFSVRSVEINFKLPGKMTRRKPQHGRGFRTGLSGGVEGTRTSSANEIVPGNRQKARSAQSCDGFRHLPPEVSGLQHSPNIRIAGHFSAHGMPDGPYVVVPFRVRSRALDDAL